MKAIVIESGAQESELVMRDIDAPATGAGQVKIRVHAASVNRADLAQRAGTHQTASPGFGPVVVGLDAAGDVVDVGAGVTGVHVGDRVMSLVAGGLSEFVVVEAALAVPIPEAWTYAEGAAGILGLMTEHNALRTVGALAPGESVLIHGAASSVGLQCVQLARHLGAGLIIATTRTDRSTELLLSLGADHVVIVDEAGFADRVLTLTENRGVDVIIDHVGGPYLEGSVRCAALTGRLVSVGRLGGGHGVLDLEAVALKRLSLVGVTFRTRDAREKAAVAAALRSEVDLDVEVLRPRIDRVLPWTRARQAQDLLAENSHLGKVVLALDDQAQNRSS
ncbi:NAD(P)H-quinone oxidoreductase [Cryobacterium sp. MLB-32]|uniref:zinc-binding dehydrogenase n=1 Tax=Cryobacterium sp. MLB-32 TaxID=1529318 RepID=UPI0004E62068|nr:zinc-binding dehydrogenase [Cryobacterium sp. MLB-32]KFF60749.1 NAD(P)H-quinone oxidoreductase [Cryobacterium sp. MLB-32]